MLAAGQSERMGRPKPLLELDGETFLERAIRLLRLGGCRSVTVVLNAKDVVGRQLARASGAEVVVNPRDESEPIDSLRLAVESLPPDSLAALVLPVDAPLVSLDAIHAVIEAFGERRAPAVVPVHAGQDGHPVLVSWTLFDNVQDEDLAEGLRSLLEAHADEIERVAVDDAGVLADVDTPEQYARLMGEGCDAAGAAGMADAQGTEGTEGANGGEGTGTVERLSAVGAARAVLEAMERGEDIVVVTLVDPPEAAGPRLLRGSDGNVRGTLGETELDAAAEQLALEAVADTEPFLRTVTVSAGTRTLYVEARRSPESLLVVGAGHIAVPLARLGIGLGFAVTVLDDREEFASETRFEPGVRVLRADFESDPFQAVTIGPRTYVALVTRGHLWDFDCLRRLLAYDVRPRYIGMIGSRRRVRAAFHALVHAGVPRDELARVHAPIGLDLGAETPEEIAVSIVAQLIQVRHGATAMPLAGKEQVLNRLLRGMSE